MYTNVNLAAPIGALALLGTAFILFAGVVLLLQSIIVRKSVRARVVAVIVLTIGIAYFVVMLAFSIFSHDKLLARGEEKHFCELDCHLAYSIVNIEQASSIGQGGGRSIAQGRFTVVTIKTRFDETTIAPWRGNGLLSPNGRVVTLIDQTGHRYRAVGQSGTPLMTPLRPGESYTTEVVFDLAVDAKPTTLLINEDAWETRLVIGHENSLLHGQTRFQI